MFAGLIPLANIPHYYNFPIEITEANAEVQYRLAARLIRSMNMVVTAYFGYLVFMKIQIGFGRAEALAKLSTPLFLGTLSAILVVYFILASRSKS